MEQIHFTDFSLVIGSPAHAPKLYKAIDQNRSYLRVFLPWVEYSNSVSDSQSFLEHAYQNYQQGLELSYHIFRGDELIGRVGLHEINKANRHAAIGYWLAEHEQGKGIITSSCNSIINIAFEELNLNRLEILTATTNEKSTAIPKRLGFVHEGVLRQIERHGEQFFDLNIFSLLKGEWIKSN